MKHVLIVDDEKPFLMSVRDGLAHHGEQFQLHLAFNGQEAVKVLQQQPVDLIVTDLKMPVMDGFQLLAYLSGNFPAIPVIVMTAFGTPEIEARIKHFRAFHYLEKPLDLEALAGAIDQAISTGSRSFIRGITLATFLQLVQMEKKTCTLKIKSGGEVGQLFILRGEMMDAETASAKGEKAAYQIVCWPDPEIEMDGVCRRREKAIQASIEHILLEAFRIEDERRNAGEMPDPVCPDAQSADWADVQQQLAGPTSKAPSAAVPRRSEAAAVAPVKAAPTSLRDYLGHPPEVTAYALFDAKGYLQEQQFAAGGLGKLIPSICLTAATQAGAQFGHRLEYIEMRDRDGTRFLLCQAPGGQLVAQLKTGKRGGDLADKLAKAIPAS